MGLWVYGVAVAAVLAATVACLVTVRRSRRSRAELEHQLAATREDLAALTAQIEAVMTQVVEARREAEAHIVARTEPAPFVITGIVTDPEGDAVAREAQIVRAIETSRPVWLPAKPVREVLVKTVAFGHGVRRALSSERRDRMVLEMRAEVRRSRRQRKAEMKALRKYLRDRRRSAA